MDNVKRAIARLLLDFFTDEHVALNDLYNRLSSEGFPRRVVAAALEEMQQPGENLVSYGFVGPDEAMFPTHRLLPGYTAYQADGPAKPLEAGREYLSDGPEKTL